MIFQNKILLLLLQPGITWTICNQNGTFSYSKTEPDERQVIYPTIINAGVQVLIFNGEADACVVRKVHALCVMHA
jgi:hypothetical protein